MRAALEFELLKARRAGVFRWGAVAVAVGVPAVSTLFFVLARNGGDAAAALKAQAMINDFSLAGLVGVTGQVLTVSMLLTAGIAVSWSFGREFVDEAVPALFALATPRSAVAAAKFCVLLGWAVTTVLTTVVLTVIAGVGLGLTVDGPALTTALHALTAGVLSAGLALPFAFVSSWRRGYLAGFVALVAVVVVTQLLTAIGTGGWFPYAAPSLWMGMGGVQAAAGVSDVQLLLPVLVGAAAVGLTLDWWRHAEAR